MSGIHPNIYKRLRTTLLNYGPFASDSELKAAFIDARINPWRDRLPKAGNPASRVKATVDFLYNQYSETQENALVLLLHVLSDQSHPGDACHLELAELASELESAIKGPDMPSEEQPVQTLPQQLNTSRSHQPRQSVVTSVGEKTREFVMPETMDLRKQGVLAMRRRKLLSKCLERLTKTQFDELAGLTLFPAEQDDLTLPRTGANFLNDMHRWNYLDKVERVLRQKWPDLVARYLAELDGLSIVTESQEPQGEAMDVQPRSSQIHPEAPLYPTLTFTNRLDEIRELTDPYAPAYYLVDAPAGYGKTTLLREVRHRFRAKSWKCAYVSVQEHRSLHAIIQELASKLGISDSVESSVAIQTHANVRVAGQDFGRAFKKHHLTESDHGSLIACSGLVLLIDIDKNPWNALMPTVGALLKDFIPGLEQVLHDFRPFRDAGSHNPFRMILAGRYLRHWVSEIPHSLPFEMLPLTPFSYKPVRDATEAFLSREDIDRSQEDAEQIVAHLLHYTAGHPGCIARVLKLYRHRNESPNQFFKNYRDEILDGIVCPEAEAVRRNIPTELSGYFDDLGVFRYLNEAVLNIWLRERDPELAEFDREYSDEFELADALIGSYLMTYKHDLLRDNITRRLLAIRLLRDVGPRRFAGRCEQAQRVYQEYLQNPSAQRPHLWAIESLFQFLQRHTADIQDADKKAEVKEEFLGETVSKVLTLLAKGRDPRREHRALTRALGDDWEFQFTVNYFLREDQYNTEPYESLEEQIEIFFDTEIGRQGES